MGLVIIAGCDDSFGHELVAGLDGLDQIETVVFPTLEAASGAIEADSPTVVVVGASVDAAEGIALAMTLQLRDADAQLLLLAEDLDTEMLRAALKAGVRDVLTDADGAAAVVSAIGDADGAVMRRRGFETACAAPGEAAPTGKVITVFSTKGGVGKSVLSTNIAVALAHDVKKKVVLVDLDLEFGDVSVMLQLPPDRTIFDAAQAFGRLDPQMLGGFLVEHSSGLRALLAPVHPEEAESVTTGRIAQIIAMLRTMADFVVIDTPASLSDVVLTSLEQSDIVLAVATLDVPSVKNTKVSLQKLHQIGFDGTKVRLVLNRADSKVWLEPQEIEKAIADRIMARVPSDRLVPRSVNKGVPVVLDAPRSAVARSILALARDVATAS